jgi:hypothetical protein
VRLFSGDELVFIGPGSEWFWAALSGIVTMVTLLAIWRQLRIQASQAATEQVDATMREFFSERLLGHQLAVLLAMQAGVDQAHLPEGSVAAIHNYFQKLGQLVKARHVDLGNISGLAQIGQAWWATLEPQIRRMTAAVGSTASKGDFEWLVEKFADVQRRAGVTLVYDEAYLRDSLERRIAITRDMLRIEQSLRTVMIAPPEAAAKPPAGLGSQDSPVAAAATES